MSDQDESVEQNEEIEAHMLKEALAAGTAAAAIFAGTAQARPAPPEEGIASPTWVDQQPVKKAKKAKKQTGSQVGQPSPKKPPAPIEDR